MAGTDASLKTAPKTRLLVPFLGLFLSFAVGVVALWYFVGFVLPSWEYPDNSSAAAGGAAAATPQGNRGTLGDQFGAVNALFSGLAFAGVIAALILQQRAMADAEMQHQRELHLQVVLDILDDLRSEAWGNAHAAMWAWKKKFPDDYIARFGAQRKQEGTEAAAFEKHRREFVKPLHKVWRLRQVINLDRETVRCLIAPEYANTLMQISEDLEAAIRDDYYRDMFKWVAGLWSKDEIAELGSWKPPTNWKPEDIKDILPDGAAALFSTSSAKVHDKNP
jgi:hypothetical protein